MTSMTFKSHSKLRVLTVFIAGILMAAIYAILLGYVGFNLHIPVFFTCILSGILGWIIPGVLVDRFLPNLY